MIQIIKIGMVSLIPFLLVACGNANPDITSPINKGTMVVDYVVVRPTGVTNVLNIPGTLLATEAAMLSAQSSGKVTEILFQEGEPVQEGQILVRIDDRALRAQQNTLEAQLTTAKKDLERKLQLADIQGVSASIVDEARLKVADLEAQKDRLAVQIDHTTIRAPFTGVIGLRSVSIGTYLAPGDPVARLVKLNPIKLEFDVPGKYATQVAEGQAVLFTIDGSREIFEATVYATAAAIDASTRALRVRAKAPNGNSRLIPGAFANVTIALDSIPDGLMIPTDAVVPKLNDQIVYQIENGKIHETTVNAGIRKTSTVQIIEGLQVGDTVMLTGLLQAREGLPVKPGKEITLESMDQ